MSISIRGGDSSDLVNVTPEGELKVATAIKGSSGNAVDVTETGELKVILPGMGMNGGLNVSIDAMPVFYDTFEGTTFDTVNRWNSYGSLPATQSQGNLNLDPSTTANATVAVSSQPLISLNSPLAIMGAIVFEAGSTAIGNHRFWGLGTAPGNVGTADAPLFDAVGFEIDTVGIFRASVYNAGVRVFTSVLTKPTDGASFHVTLRTFGDGMFMFSAGGFDAPTVMSTVSVGSQLLPLRFHSLNSAAVTANTPTFVVQTFTVLDYARKSSSLSDGTYPWRKATVDIRGALLTATRSSDQVVTSVGSQGAAVTATLPAAGSGLFHYITKVSITRYATANITGNNTPSTVTTTNLPGALAWTAQTYAVTGTLDRITEDLSSPLKSSVANTATTVVCPGTNNVIWRATVHYFTGI